MGNQASTHSPELVDTSMDDWYGGGGRRSNQYDDGDDWAPRDPRSPKTPTALRSPKTPTALRSPANRTSMYDEDVRDPVASTKPSNIFRPNLEPLVEATAAVFHMSSMDNYDANADWSLPAKGSDISISERSAAVFKHLEQQARKGNHQPFVKLLETATVVSQLLMGSTSEISEEEKQPAPQISSSASSDSDDSDDDSTDDEEDDGNSTSSEQSDQPAPKRNQGGLFDRLGKNDIIDVEKMNAGAVFELLDKVKSVESTDVKEFSSAVFGMLEDVKSFNLQTPDERKVNIFRMLEENNLRDLADDVLGPDESETRDDAPQTGGEYTNTVVDAREDYPEVAKDAVEKREPIAGDNVSVLEHPEVETVDGKRSVQIKTMEGDPIDLTFVQEFDEAFNEFMGQHPKFLLKSPELVHNIRIAKLQKLLAYMNAKEKSTVAEYNMAEETKKKMEEEYQLKLREVASAKAARQIYFKSELDKIALVSNTLEAKFKWAVVAAAESRTKKHYQMRQDFAAEKPDETRQQLLQRLPKDVPGQAVMAVIRDDGIPSTMTAAEKGAEIRKLQMNIAFLTSEVKLWQSKLEVMEAEKKNVAWVETILQQLTTKQMNRLKGRHQRKTGIQVE